MSNRANASPARAYSLLRQWLREHRLYAILDATLTAPNHVGHAEAMVAAGVKILQWRAKSLPVRQAYQIGRDLRVLTRREGVVLVINDRPDLATALDADWLHLGQDDLPPEAARALFTGLIGYSTHDLVQVSRAATLGVAYIGFGPVFVTGSKANPDPPVGLAGLRRAVENSPVPVVAIGGLTADTVGDVLATGVTAVAMIAALTGTDPAETERKTRRVLEAVAKAATGEAGS